LATQKARDFIQSGSFGDIVMARLTYNINQPTRWRRPALVAALKPEDTDWARYRLQRSTEPFNAHHYIEFRLYWPYSSGILDQWMVHPIDALHFITGMPRPRSVVASGGIYQWKDGRVNPDTVSAVFDYGPLHDESKGFQATFSGRMDNSAEGSSDYYYSTRGTLNVNTGRVTAEGGMNAKNAAEAHLPADNLPDQQLFERSKADNQNDELRADDAVSSHMRNWMECVRRRKSPTADIEAGYNHSIALCMAITAMHSGKRTMFDEKSQEVVTI
jgi:predicted dehydrogenase